MTRALYGRCVTGYVITALSHDSLSQVGPSISQSGRKLSIEFSPSDSLVQDDLFNVREFFTCCSALAETHSQSFKASLKEFTYFYRKQLKLVTIPV